MGKPYHLYTDNYAEPPVLQITSAGRVIGLMMRFKLLRAEAELAIRLADGMDLVAAGASLGYTKGSTRTFSKRIYFKLGIHTQAQLVGVVYKAILEALEGAVPGQLPGRSGIDDLAPCRRG